MDAQACKHALALPLAAMHPAAGAATTRMVRQSTSSASKYIQRGPACAAPQTIPGPLRRRLALQLFLAVILMAYCSQCDGILAATMMAFWQRGRKQTPGRPCHTHYACAWAALPLQPRPKYSARGKSAPTALPATWPRKRTCPALVTSTAPARSSSNARHHVQLGWSPES